MRRIHFAADEATVVNVTLVDRETDPEAGTIDVAGDVAVGPGMIRDGDGFAHPPRVVSAADVDAHAQALREAGYAPTHPDLAGHRLQLRDSEDRTNWLGSELRYRLAIAGGFGDVVGATFRTSRNATVTLSFADAHAVLLGLLAWAEAIMLRSWAIKDELAAGDAVELDDGWPE